MIFLLIVIFCYYFAPPCVFYTAKACDTEKRRKETDTRKRKKEKGGRMDSRIPSPFVRSPPPSSEDKRHSFGGWYAFEVG